MQSGQAQDKAAAARQGLIARDSLVQTQGQLTDLRDQIGAALAPLAPSAPAATESPAPVLNAFGQPTGTLVNVTA